MCVHAKLLQSCPTLCNPMDCSPPGSSVHGILQERILEWIAIYFLLQGIFLTQGLNLHLSLLHCQVGSLPLAPHGKPKYDDNNGEINMIQMSFFSVNPFITTFPHHSPSLLPCHHLSS